MSPRPISLSSDLKQLRDDGYDISIRGNHLVVNNVPYVNTQAQVAYGTLVTRLTLSGDVTTKPDSHVAMFAGDTPCDQHGQPLASVDSGIQMTKPVETESGSHARRLRAPG